MTTFDEPARLASLYAAQAQAQALFAGIEAAGLIRAGVLESVLSNEIHALAAEQFGVQAHWHRKIVRTGANTVATFHDPTPDLTIAADDILFLDFGPVFDNWEADFGRTFVLGDDRVKQALRRDLGVVWTELRDVYEAHPDITGEQLYAEAHRAAERRGWIFGGQIAGHLVGEFPHTAFPGERSVSLIAPGNDMRMRDRDADGRERYWILEVHLVEPQGRFGAFSEELLSR
ncbi:aminopeptidase P family protein [Phenylobacterium sp. 20VBR1]|uniref:Aminopeptidase P family protein n=1 Tax=Phenylobacterium glaciei TaxID=2803784 RepID=A0A941D281_9CAUL|nr:M24 family metallopeptidase [Phenylobacterium glaciei]MBR7620811.1 aminopeptidase P family protein [Phenylobacterium glaciei]